MSSKNVHGLRPFVKTLPKIGEKIQLFRKVDGKQFPVLMFGTRITKDNIGVYQGNEWVSDRRMVIVLDPQSKMMYKENDDNLSWRKVPIRRGSENDSKCIKSIPSVHKR